MRYAYGIIFGALLPGIIFVGSAFIKLAGFGITDPTILQTIWNMYLIWFAVSIILIVLPLIISYIQFRTEFREIIAFEFGGLLFFTPFWFIFATDISGDYWVDVLINGIENGLPTFGYGGAIQGTNIGPIVIIPSMIIFIVLGLYVLRPSFVSAFASGTMSISFSLGGFLPSGSAPTEGEEGAAPAATGAPAAISGDSVEELKSLLTELGVAPAMIDSLINAGIATTTDLVSTSPEQIAQITGMGLAAAENLNAQVQKKMWFEGI
ncbi:MAG: helix-hairpin-helix domain-containing protein [Candidatus Thorarchaeota archaeon]|nr:helix-hairpin-helix domain-containing protein [Candidatus Thorarchaeota archaeon]